MSFSGGDSLKEKLVKRGSCVFKDAKESDHLSPGRGPESSLFFLFFNFFDLKYL